MPACPVCEGPGMLLGDLGTRRHWRCRNCGMDWSTAPIPTLEAGHAHD